MNRLTTALFILTLSLTAGSCTLTSEPRPDPEPKPKLTVEEPPPPAPEPLIVAEEFGPLVYRISPELRPQWERVLELHERLFTKQGRMVDEDDLHILYNQADVNDDDVLDKAEIDEAFRGAKRDYEKYLERRSRAPSGAQ